MLFGRDAAAQLPVDERRLPLTQNFDFTHVYDHPELEREFELVTTSVRITR